MLAFDFVLVVPADATLALSSRKDLVLKASWLGVPVRTLVAVLSCMCTCVCCECADLYVYVCVCVSDVLTCMCTCVCFECADLYVYVCVCVCVLSICVHVHVHMAFVCVCVCVTACLYIVGISAPNTHHINVLRSLNILNPNSPFSTCTHYRYMQT